MGPPETKDERRGQVGGVPEGSGVSSPAFTETSSGEDIVLEPSVVAKRLIPKAASTSLVEQNGLTVVPRRGNGV